MKKVCHITSMHKRYSTRIFYKQCASLAKNGFDVYLLVNDEDNDEIREGVHIISSGVKPKNRKEIFIDSKKALFEKAISINAEIYQLHDPDLIPLGLKLKKKGKKIIFDSHEDMPALILDKKWIPAVLRKIVSKAYEIYEKKSLSKFDGLISVTPHIVERLKTINPNTVMITNYPIINSDFNLPTEKKSAICFAGGISPQYHHFEIIKALESVDGITYLLAGKGPKTYMDELQSLKGWEKVKYLGYIPHEEVKEIYFQAFAGVALHRSSQLKDEGSLGVIKLFEVMSEGLPIICSDYRLWKEIIEKHKCGICIQPDNVEQIANSVKYLRDNPAEAKKMGSNGRNAVEKEYNWSSQENVLIQFYDGIYSSLK